MINRTQMRREILSLSSGTIAGLCGSAEYEDIDEYVRSWHRWIGEQHCGAEWRTWQECHDDFVTHLIRVTIPAFQF